MAFNLPVQNYFSKVQNPTPWMRPDDWPVITDAVNEVQFLMADLGDANCTLNITFKRNSGSQNLVIDWGDGSTDILTATTTTTTHSYIKGTGEPCSLGYTTFAIRVYFTGVGVSSIGVCQIKPVYITGNSISPQTCYVLEAYYGDDTVPLTTPSFATNVGNSYSFGSYTYIKYVKLPASVSWSSLQYMFYGSSVAQVIMPTSAPNLSSLYQTFRDCYFLESINIPVNSIGITAFYQTFYNCWSLASVSLPPTLNSCTTFQQAFSSCGSIKNINLPSLNNCINFSSAFGGCYQVEYIKFVNMGTIAGTYNFSFAFSNCYNLQNVYLPSSVNASSSYNLNNAFLGCASLKSITLSSNMNVSNFSNTFANCFDLTSCSLPTNIGACTLFSSAFSSCYSLKEIVLPQTASVSGLNLSSAFINCYKLEKATIPSTLRISNMQSTFQNCFGLKTLEWNPGAQDLLTTLSSAFSGCVLLETINLPTSMNNLTNLNLAFGSCRNLKEITLPPLLDKVTTAAQVFYYCNSLRSVIMPESMSACTNFSNVLAECYSITSFTFPDTVSPLTTTFSSACSRCTALEKVVFPGSSQLDKVTSIDSIFFACSNLKTIVNFERIGSLTATPLISGTTNNYARLENISFSGPYSRLWLNGQTVGHKADVQSVRILNTSAGQWTGSSPQINVSYTNMSTANLIQLFTDMAAQGNVSSKTINITGAVGASGLTTTDRQIITTKGWVITG